MVSDQIVEPHVGVVPAAGFHGWEGLNGELELPAFALPLLHLLPPVAAATSVERPEPGLRIWDVLAAWRSAERELADTAVDSADWPRVHAGLVGLRAAYHRLFHERLSSTNQVLRVAGTNVDRLAVTDAPVPERQ